MYDPEDMSIASDAELLGVGDLTPIESAPVLPEAAKRVSMTALVGALAGGNLLSSVLRMVGGILQSRFVLPSVLGLFNGVGLVVGYAQFLQLGILTGLNRELPYFIGKGNRTRAEALAAAAQFWAILISTVVATILLGASARYLYWGDMQMAMACATNAILVFVTFYGTYYLQFTYRTSSDFARIAFVNVIQSLVALALVMLVKWMDFYGLCLRALLSGIVAVSLLHYWRPVRVGPKWNWPDVKHLLRIGLPIFGAEQAYASWVLLNRTLVLVFTGTHGLGLYTMVVLACETAELLPMAVSQVLYPRMAQVYGQTGRIQDLLPMCVKPMVLTFVAMGFLMAVAGVVAPYAVEIVVPDYVEAVPAIRWVLLVPIVTSFFPISTIFNVIRRQDLNVAAIVLGMVAYVAALIALTRNGVSLVAFPQALLAGRAVFAASGGLFLVYATRCHNAGESL